MTKQINLTDPECEKARNYFVEKYPQYKFRMSWQFASFQSAVCSEFKCDEICISSLTMTFNNEKHYEWFLLKWI